LCAFLFNAAIAQRPKPDLIKSDSGIVTLQPVFHGSLVISWNNKTIYIDPHGTAANFAGLKPADLILITDIHSDHMDTTTLSALKTSGATFIVPQAVANLLPPRFKKNMKVMANGESLTEKTVPITAIAMYNAPENDVVHHPKGRGNGYVLNLGEKIIYISGDTEDSPEMSNLKNVDVAFICMNQPYTMNVKQAASAVLSFKPRIVYPYHYRGQKGFSDLNAFKKFVLEGDPSIEVRIRKWYGVH